MALWPPRRVLVLPASSEINCDALHWRRSDQRRINILLIFWLLKNRQVSFLLFLHIPHNILFTVTSDRYRLEMWEIIKIENFRSAALILAATVRRLVALSCLLSWLLKSEFVLTPAGADDDVDCGVKSLEVHEAHCAVKSFSDIRTIMEFHWWIKFPANGSAAFFLKEEDLEWNLRF